MRAALRHGREGAVVTPFIAHVNYYAAHVALHRLWSKAVGTPDYDKQEWKALEDAIVKLAEDGVGPVGSPGVRGLLQRRRR